MARTAKHDWPMVRLGDVADFVNGYAFKPADWGEEGRPIIRIQNLTSTNKAFNYTSRRVPEKYSVSKGDILVSWSATLGVFEWDGPNALLNQHIFKVVPTNKVEPSYLKHIIPAALGEMKKHLHGATMKHVNRKEFLGTKIPLPPLDEQRRIAAVLDEVGRLSSIQIKKVEGLEALKRVVVEEFLKARGDQEVELGTISEIQSGITKGRKVSKKSTTSIVPYLSVSNVKDGFLQLHPIKEINATNDEISRYQLQRGDIVLTEGGDPDKLGRGTVWNNEIPVCIHQNHIFRVRILQDSTVMTPEVLAAILSSSRPKKHFLRSAKQTTGIASINKSQLSRTLIPNLTRDDVRALSLQIELLKLEQERAETQRSSFEELRQSLSTRAFQGEL